MNTTTYAWGIPSNSTYILIPLVIIVLGFYFYKKSKSKN